MSSWANRHTFTKRNISQIPAELRPQIIPRFQQPQVILSESFQKKENEVIYPDEPLSFEPIKGSYSIKKVESRPFPNAIELSYKDQSYVFVILRNIKTSKDNDLWISSYNSIRKFYTNLIVIIDDNSTINTVNGKLINTEVIKSEWNGAGEILPYYYFLHHKWADRMIFLHDSMFLHRPFRDSELEGSIRFHWHFENTEIRDHSKITNLLSILSHSQDMLDAYTQSTIPWKGCFGGASIIDLELVEQLENTYEFFSKLVMSIRTRKDRETFERVFGIVLFHEGLVDTTSNFGNISSYPHAFESQNNNPETAAHILSQVHYDTAIIKVWRGR
jgi:hypothetical protein